MARAKHKSKQQWLHRHVNDEYVQRAQREGYRSRAVYKLLELQQRDRIIQPGQTIVDLGAAPGGWSQFAVECLRPTSVGQRRNAHSEAPSAQHNSSAINGRVIAVDLLPMQPIRGVEVLNGDFSDEIVLARLMQLLDNHPVDLVMSDMAPNISGIKAVDLPRSMYLAELALDLVHNVLRNKGVFVVKLFQGSGFDELIKQMRRDFEQLLIRKPKASRPKSREVYALGKGFRG